MATTVLLGGLAMVLRLTDEIRMEVYPEHHRRLKIIDDHDWSNVMKKVRSMYRTENGFYPSNEWLEQSIFGLKQYYAVALLDPLNNHAVSARVDMLWHAHMLFSQQYSRFCDEVMGRYVHHTPLDDDNVEQVRNVKVLYEYTVEILGQIFGIAGEDNWPLSGLNYRLICFHHKRFPDVDHLALFPEVERGLAYAFEGAQ